MFTYQAFQIILFLIPGFITAKLLSLFSIEEKKSITEKSIDALIFSIMIYSIYALIPFEEIKAPLTFNEQSGIFNYDALSLILLLALSIVLSIVLSFLKIKDWHMKILRKFNITRNTSRESIWIDVFYENKKTVIVNFADGSRLIGWPQKYSNDQNKPFLYLTKAAWLKKNKKTGKNEYIELEADGILITPEHKIETIEFWSPKK